MCRKSDDEVYEWIRKNGPGVAIPREHTMAILFPEGPHEETERRIDMVAMTPESALWFRSANRDRSDRCVVVEAMEFQADVDGNSRPMKGRCRFRPILLRVLIPDSPGRISKDYEDDRFTI